VGFNQIWEWDGIRWSLVQMIPTTGFSFLGKSIAYDRARNESVLVGDDFYFSPPSFTFLASGALVWDGTTLTRSGNGGPESLVEDTAHGYVLGTNAPYTYAWNGTGWTRIVGQFSFPYPGEPTLVFDGGRQRPVFTSGGETGEWDGVAWVKSLPMPAPV